MGFDKSRLPFADQTFLERIVGTLGPVVDRIVVVKSQHQEYESCSKYMVVQDRENGKGPLEGVASGLAALGTEHTAAFVTSCDVPLLRAAVVDLLFGQLGDFDAVVPVDFGQPKRIYGLTSIYRTRILARLNSLIEQGRLRVSDLPTFINAKEVSLENLQTVDPNLASLTNINSMEDYLSLARSHGFPVPAQVLEQLKTSDLD